MKSLPSSDDQNSSSQYSPKEKRFDERSVSKTSVQLRAHNSALPSPQPPIVSVHATEQSHNTTHLVKWSNSSFFLKESNLETFLSLFGHFLLIEPASNFLAIGSEKGYIICVSYQQKVLFILEPLLANMKGEENERCGKPTCISIVGDETHVAAGYETGIIFKWRLPPLILETSVVQALEVVIPISLQHRFAENGQGHLVDVPIRSVQFIGNLHNHFVSTDSAGLVFFHHTFKKFFKRHYVSQKILGQNDTNNADPDASFLIHDSLILPPGTSTQLTDYIGLLAVITGKVLILLSVKSLDNPDHPHPMVHFYIGKPVKARDKSRGCLGWYPCIKTKKGTRNAKLAYAWGDILTILEIDQASLPKNLMANIEMLKEKDKGIPKLKPKIRARWAGDSGDWDIESLLWLNSDIIAAIFRHQKTHDNNIRFFYYNGGLEEVGMDSIDGQQLAWIQLNQNMILNCCFKIYRHRLMGLVNSHNKSTKSIIFGECFKWVDRIKALLDDEDYWMAIHVSYEYYSSNNKGDLLISGLPHNVEDRQAIVRPYLMSIMKDSVIPLFRSRKASALKLYMSIISSLNKDERVLEILDLVYEALEGHNTEFFDLLEEEILRQRIRYLPPTIFKNLVEHYVQHGRGDRLTELICLLDISTLNIDMTLMLCSRYKLYECEVYIWNEVFHDYTTPLVMLMSEANDGEENNVLFTYMSFLLSGRKYPSDDFFDETEAKNARESICNILFSTCCVQYPPETSHVLLGTLGDDVFPYLSFLLKLDTFEMLRTLNEFFENPCLNDENGSSLTRQYIVEALQDVFESNKQSLSAEDFIYLAIFNARNYPKYFQFIRLSETTLRETISTLCQSRNKSLRNDCELALESLLSVYEVESDGHLLEQMRAAGFYNVLFSIYKSTGQFTKALNMWLSKQRDIKTENSESKFSVFANILEMTYQSNDSSLSERANLADFIGNHFAELVSLNPEDMVLLANTYDKNLHLNVLNIEGSLSLNYLKIYFDVYKSSKLDKISVLLLCRFLEQTRDKNVLAQFLQSLVEFKEAAQSLQKFFNEHGDIEAEMMILVQEKNFYEAHCIAKKYLETQKQAKHWSSSNLHELRNIMEADTKVCTIADSAELWAQSVEELIMLGEKVEDEHAQKLINENIYKKFRTLSDEGKSFYDVFDKILAKARLGNVRLTLQEVLQSYSIENGMHSVTVAKINKGILKFIEIIEKEKLHGWLVKEKNCTFCGKSLFEGETGSRQKVAWESRQRSLTDGEKLSISPLDEAKWTDCQIICFKCQHVYHSRCFSGTQLKCMVCEAEP